jgi:hypothetical protein
MMTIVRFTVTTGGLYAGEILFSTDDFPSCANPAPFGAGAHCYVPALPELEISP